MLGHGPLLGSVMAEVGCKLPQGLTLHASDERAGIGDPMLPLGLRTGTCPGALAPQAA